jgi:hypothetical protein
VDRDREKGMKKKVTVLSLCAVLFATCWPIQAQQPGKVFRIGFLDSSNASGMAGLLKAFRQELSKLGWIEGRISPSSTGLPSKRMSACLSLQRTWFDLRLI